MKTETTTVNIYCKHNNGWYNRIYFKKWFFTFSKLYFFCIECQRAIEVNDDFKND